MPRAQLDAIRQLPNVVSVTETYELEPELDESRALLGLQTLWNVAAVEPARRRERRPRRADRLRRQRTASVLQRRGFTAPAGYPKAQRVSGGVRTDLSVATYASNKVIVGNVYAYPGEHHGHAVGAGLAARDARRRDHGRQSNGTYNYTSGRHRSRCSSRGWRRARTS